MLAAETIEPGYLNLLAVIGGAVPVAAVEILLSQAGGTPVVRFAAVPLR